MNELEPLETINVTQTVQERLMQFIRAQGLTAGSRLPSETQLTESLGISRSALREALYSLQALSVIEVKTGLGWYVRDISFDSMAKAIISSLDLHAGTLVELEDLRLNLEGFYLEEAIHALTAEDLLALEEAVNQIERLADAGASYFEPDRNFHLKLFSRLSNQLLQKLLEMFWALLHYALTSNRQISLELDVISDREVSREFAVVQAYKHRPMLDAIRSRDVDLARKRLMDSNRPRFKRYSGNSG